MSFITILKISSYAVTFLVPAITGIVGYFKQRKKHKIKIIELEMERDYEKEKSARIIENMDRVMDYESKDDDIRHTAEVHIKELKGATSDKSTKKALNNLRSDLYNSYHVVKL